MSRTRNSLLSWRYALLPIALAASTTYSGTPALTVAGWATTSTVAAVLPGMTDTGLAGASTPMPLMVTLNLRNREALEAYFKHITTPSDPLYKHYLRPDEFAAAYSPRMTDVDTVIHYLVSKGFTNIQLSPNRTQIRVTGTVAMAQAAFNTSIHNFSYQGKPVLANATAAQVPAALSGVVMGVIGLNTIPTHWFNHPKPAAKPGAGVDLPSLPPVPGTNAINGFTAAQFQQVYDVGKTSTGALTSIAIIGEGDMTAVLGTHLQVTDPNDPNYDKKADLRIYEDVNKIAHVPVTLIYTNPVHTDVTGADEFDLDTQTSTGLAGNVKQLYVYSGSSLSDEELLAELDHFVTDNLAQAASESIGGCESIQAALGSIGAYDALFLQMATQGQTFFASSGDAGSACLSPMNGIPAGGVPGVEFPASDTYVVGVGGTTLTTDSGGNYALEVTWNAGGGGTSTFEKSPPWQIPVMTGAVSGTSFKGVPDIALDADPNTGALIYVAGAVSQIGGTSLASPLSLGAWARMESSHVTASSGPNPLGYAPPDLYALGPSPSGAALANETGFHDIIAGSNGAFTAGPGYDLTTGLGSFDIAATSAALKKIAPALAPAPVLGGDVCSLPGNKVAAGTKGENVDAAAGTSGHNVLATYYSEHYTAGQTANSVTFGLDTNTIDSTGAYYQVNFTTEDSTGSTAAEYYVAYDPTQAVGSQFTYGHFTDANGTTAMDGTIAGTAATVTNKDNTTVGRITWVLPRADVATLASAAKLDRIYGVVSQNVEGAVGLPYDTTAQGMYNLDSSYYCFPVPVAALTVSSAKVVAGTVDTFSAAGSTAATGESVVSYNFNFGDGTISGPQAKSSLDHTYATAGSYTATVTVADTSGKQNANAAAVTVTVTPPPPPTAFTYAERTGVAVSTVITSESITLAGSAASYPISIVGDAGTNAQYSLNGGAFTTAAGTIKPGDTLVVRQTSSSAYTTATSVTVTVGTYSTPFKVTTMDAPATPPPSTTPTVDHVPAPFDFGTTSGVAPSTPTASATLTLTDYDNAPVTPGQFVSYSIDGGAFTTARGTIYKGQKLQVKMTSNAKSLGYTKSYIDVGGVRGTFTVRTRK